MFGSLKDFYEQLLSWMKCWSICQSVYLKLWNRAKMLFVLYVWHVCKYRKSVRKLALDKRFVSHPPGQMTSSLLQRGQDGWKETSGGRLSAAQRRLTSRFHICRRLITPAAGTTHSSSLSNSRNRFAHAAAFILFHNVLIIASPKATGAVLLRYRRYGLENNATLLTECLKRSIGRIIDGSLAAVRRSWMQCSWSHRAVWVSMQ